MNEIGYHGTCSKHKDSIESNGFDPAKCNYRADHWLGQGVYFFDDYEKALWWSATAVLHNNDFRSYISTITTQPGMAPILLPAMNIVAMLNDQKKN